MAKNRWSKTIGGLLLHSYFMHSCELDLDRSVSSNSTSTFKLVFEAPGEALLSRSFAAYLPSRQCGYCVRTSQSSCFRRTSLFYSHPKFRPPEWHVLHWTERNQSSHGFAATEILAKGYQNCFPLSANSSSLPVENTIRLLSPQSSLSQNEPPWYPSRLPRPGYSNSAWTIRIQAPDIGQLYRYLAHANRY